ncbi:MAG: ferredoxin [Deltaproteobacteria bacterium]|jgi:ferredoxin
MKVTVDELKCRTVGLCVKECPDVFRFREGSKRATVRMGHIPPALEDCCRRAAALCPNRAVKIDER